MTKGEKGATAAIPPADTAVVKANTAVVETDMALVKTNTAVVETEKADTAARKQAAEKTKTSVSQPDSAALAAALQAEYNKDARVRLGAYEITGLDREVVVLQGQTFKGICKAYLGDGMECYVEVFNGGKKEAAAGDTIKIPKLKFKKRNNR